jgi:hypothetical protein
MPLTYQLKYHETHVAEKQKIEHPSAKMKLYDDEQRLSGIGQKRKKPHRAALLRFRQDSNLRPTA